jgi:nitrogen fixation protein FixH
MNWGTSIALFFTVFAISMVSAVIASTKHAPQLIQKDYYALDLHYQARLEQKQHTNALAAPPRLAVDHDQQKLLIYMPVEATIQKGTLKCYRSATTANDVVISIKDSTDRVEVSTQNWPQGRWHIEVEWDSPAGVSYFWETTASVH